jgi:hypothetical protein
VIADPLVFARWIHFAATAMAAGTVGLTVLVAEPAARMRAPAGFAVLRRQLVMVTWGALALAILSGAAWLALLASDILGASLVDVCLHGGAWPVIADTRFGMVWCVRLLLALFLSVLLLWPALETIQLAAAAGFMALPALTGHAGATPGIAGDIHLVADMVHLLAAGAWLGGLPASCEIDAVRDELRPKAADRGERADAHTRGAVDQVPAANPRMGFHDQLGPPVRLMCEVPARARGETCDPIQLSDDCVGSEMQQIYVLAQSEVPDAGILLHDQAPRKNPAEANVTAGMN